MSRYPGIYSRRRNHAIWICCSMTAMLAGCLPIPNDEQVLPAMHGRVVTGGVPVVGAEIHVIAEAAGERIAERIATTNADGRFSHRGRSVRRTFVWILGDPSYDYALRIRYAGAWHQGYWDRRVGHAPKRIGFACELVRAEEGKCEPLAAAARP